MAQQLLVVSGRRRGLAERITTTGVLSGGEDDLKARLHNVGSLVLLADDVATATRTLATAADVDHLVVVSTAAVYGAWPTNGVPLNEDAPIRPNPSFAPAVERAEIERLAMEWADEHPTATVCTLRPALVLGGPEGEDRISRALTEAPGFGAVEGRPPVQYLHVEDLVSAVRHAVERRLAGTYNVAPDGWLAGETARELGATKARLLPTRLVRRLVRGADPLLRHPWVVANDKLEATGWQPSYSAEEVVVATRRGSWWRELSPKRKQELALAGAGVAIAGAATGIAVLVRWWRKRTS